MFFFSMIEDGPWGLNGSHQNRPGEGDVLEEGDVSLYGIDWEDMEDECQGHSSLDTPSELNPPQRIPSPSKTPLVPQAEG